ncbi:cytochrome P450 6a2-like [Frieseomelitta varia]|uniref:cytochrome P450 6a2-like n=1 Tax=Frieseomelitta varia TaxID=561572 RepID=UPI001CB68F30|nr:cytochrome P450 6a2-like [Frieseomelitta varia]XP_043510701.1 cytochrome P450 6a2-like [Frieseomelitta varia]XP_043510702.1 cytochrome P450 6a2-like [Frieseomelitta varia]
MSLSITEAVGLVVAVFLLIYYYSVSKLEFWQKRGVKGPRPIPFFGNFKDIFLGRSCIHDCFEKVYYDYKDEPVIGLYAGNNPLLVLRDPDLMKDVLIKDFPKFAERTQRPYREVEPLSEHLFRLEVERWRPLRTRLSPVFTSGKLKEMFHLLLECSEHFGRYLERIIAKGEPIECREISAKFTTDVIGSCAFGIEMNALAAEDSEFRKMGRKVFQTSWKTMIRDRLREYPFLFKLFGRFFVEKDVAAFFTRITKESIDYRIEHNVRRYDFVDSLIDLKQNPDKTRLLEIDDVLLTAQAFVFFAAGFETSSLTISHFLYELAVNQSIQEKVREEIKNVLQKTNGVVMYDSIKEMKYLDACFQETLRKYPVLVWLSRTALVDYTFSGTKITIPKGQQVFIPVYAIQMDPAVYPNPQVFDPERFTGDNAKSRHPMFFLPFGDGPRNCIGARFAKNQSKIAIITILSRFKVEVCDKTFKKYDMDKKALFLLQPTHGIYVKMTKLTE